MNQISAVEYLTLANIDYKSDDVLGHRRSRLHVVVARRSGLHGIGSSRNGSNQPCLRGVWGEIAAPSGTWPECQPGRDASQDLPVEVCNFLYNGGVHTVQLQECATPVQQSTRTHTHLIFYLFLLTFY